MHITRCIIFSSGEKIVWFDRIKMGQWVSNWTHGFRIVVFATHNIEYEYDDGPDISRTATRILDNR